MKQVSGKDGEEKPPTLEEAIAAAISKAITPVRAQYEKSIGEMEERTKKTISELEDRMRMILAQMQLYVCYNCHRDLISGKDAIYTASSGHKFCSHECIDRNEAKSETK